MCVSFVFDVRTPHMRFDVGKIVLKNSIDLLRLIYLHNLFLLWNLIQVHTYIGYIVLLTIRIRNTPMMVGLYFYLVMYVRMKLGIGYGENRP